MGMGTEPVGETQPALFFIVSAIYVGIELMSQRRDQTPDRHTHMIFLPRAEYIDRLKSEMGLEWTIRQLRARAERAHNFVPSKFEVSTGRRLYGYPESKKELSEFKKHHVTGIVVSAPVKTTAKTPEVRKEVAPKVSTVKPLETYEHEDHKYYSEIDRNSGYVIAYMPFLKNGFLRIPLSVDEEIHRAYSSEGANQQIAKIAQALNWKPSNLRGYLKSRGLTHASHVWPEWKIEEASIEDLVEDAIVAKAEKAKAAVDRREADRIQKDAEIGRNYREMANYLTSITIPSCPVTTQKRIVSRPKPGDFDVYFPMKDLHVGKRPFHAPPDFSLVTQEQGIKKAIDNVIAEVIQTWGVPRRFILVTGDDQLNSNSSNQTTLKGTPLGSNSVGSFLEQAETLQRVKLYQIQACLDTGADVYDHYIPSNHAPDAEFLVAKIAEAYFRNEPRVVFNTSHDTFKVVTCGNVPVFDTHGTHTSDATLPTIAARMNPPGADFSKAVIFRGHTHAGAKSLQKVDSDLNGVQLYVVPSSSAACGYEEAHGWHFTRHAMAVYRISYTKGCDSWIQV